MHALVGVDLFLDRNLVVGAGLEAPADADVDAFGVLAEHDEVDVLPPAILQRAEAIVEQPHRPVVDVEIELEARAEQDVARVTVVGDARIAERADEDRVELAQHLVAVGGQRLAGLQVVIGAPRQMLEIEAAAEDVADRLQDLDGFGGDVLADAVAGDDRNVHVRTKSGSRNSELVTSIAIAMPIPPLTHSVASPVLPRRCSSCNRVTTMRAPLHADRMAERDRAAVDVQLLSGNGHVLQHGQHLRRERLVDLDQIEIVDAKPGALLQLRDRGHRTDAHDARIDAGARPADEFRERLQSARLREVRRMPAREPRRRR